MWHVKEVSSRWDGDRLSTIDIGLKVGGLMFPFLWGGGAGFPPNTMWPGLSLPPYKCHLDPSSRLATTDMGQKLGQYPFLGGGGSGSTSNTMWPGPRHISVAAAPPTFRPTSIVAKRLDGSRCHLVSLYGGRLGPYCVSTPKRGTASHQFSVRVYCGLTVAHLSDWWALVDNLRDIWSRTLLISLEAWPTKNSTRQ